MNVLFSSLHEMRKLSQNLPLPLRSLPSSSLLYIPELQQYLLFPGLPTQDKKLRKSIILFCPEKKEFILQETSNQVPQYKEQSLLFYKNPYVYVFSGVTSDSLIQNELHCLNIFTFEWKKFYMLDGPFNRVQQGFAPIQGGAVLMGGASHPENLVFNDLWVLQVDRVKWSDQCNLKGAEWCYINFDNALPFLKGHTIWPVNYKEILIFGGFNQRYEPKNELFSINLDTKKVKLLETKGVSPSPRGFHSMIPIRSSLYAIYGGSNSEEHLKDGEVFNDLFIYDHDQLYWTKVSYGGQVSIGRCLFGMAYDSDLKQIAIMGGEGDQSIQIFQELDIDESYSIKNDQSLHPNIMYNEGCTQMKLLDDEINQLELRIKKKKAQNDSFEKQIQIQEDEIKQKIESKTIIKEAMEDEIFEMQKGKQIAIKQLILENELKDLNKEFLQEQSELLQQLIEPLKFIQSSTQQLEEFYENNLQSNYVKQTILRMN